MSLHVCLKMTLLHPKCFRSTLPSRETPDSFTKRKGEGREEKNVRWGWARQNANLFRGFLIFRSNHSLKG